MSLKQCDVVQGHRVVKLLKGLNTERGIQPCFLCSKSLTFFWERLRKLGTVAGTVAEFLFV